MIDVEAYLVGFVFVGLVGTEVLGVIARRYGFITISEQARKTRSLRFAVSALFVVGLVWWQLHAQR